MDTILNFLGSTAGGALASWFQAVGSVAAIVGAFYVAKWQFQNELRKEHLRNAQETVDRVSKLDQFIRLTWADVRALWDDPKEPLGLQRHWHNSSIRLELA